MVSTIKNIATSVPDFSDKFDHLKNVKADLILSDSDSKKFWEAMVAQANNKAEFNERVRLGIQKKYGAAQCATTTASVLEGAAIKAQLPNVAQLFDEKQRVDKQRFALTDQIEVMLKRLGFKMYDKKLYVAPRGAICFMQGRYNKHVKQHSGHVYTMYEDKGADCKDIISDNGGFQHQYAHFTESFMLPSGIVPTVRSESEPPKNPIGLSVKEIQHELNDHFDARLVEDGLLGPKTESAMKKAEGFLKLTVDGKIDTLLAKELIKLKGLANDITPTSSEPSSSRTELSVKEIQHKLNAHFDAQLVEDGLLGPKTKSAIEKAEEFLRLSVDGKIETSLVNALIELKGLVYDIMPTPIEEDKGGIQSTKFEDLKPEYLQLWDTCQIKAEKVDSVNATCASILANKARYEFVSKVTRVPWQVIAVIHRLEGGGNFKTHLHNGDSLNERTVNVPANRPKSGNPPFTWEESAIDALTGDGRFQGKQWGIAETLYFLEKYNGWGYRTGKGQATIPPRRTSYLWSFTNHYQSGKYTTDHRFDANAVSKQAGGAALLKALKYKV